MATGSRFSIRGGPRFDDGDATEKWFENADRDVRRGTVALVGRLLSTALRGVFPPEGRDAGVMSWDLLVLELRVKRAGEPLRSIAGNLGGTSGGSSTSSGTVAVSTFNDGLGLAPGLGIGDISFLGTLWVSKEKGRVNCCAGTGEGPVTRDIIASPNGPDLQLVPGALQDLS